MPLPASDVMGAPVEPTLTLETYLAQHDAGWRRRSRCPVRADLDFYSEQPREIRACKRVCSECPVKEACVLVALRHEDPWGIWGGLTGEERKHLVTGLRERTTRPPHGDNDRYVLHGCRCASCSRAHRVFEQIRVNLRAVGLDLPDPAAGHRDPAAMEPR